MFKYILDLPNITIIDHFNNNTYEINTVQSYEEDDDRVVLQCAEHTPYFKRGFVCDVICNFSVRDNESSITKEVRTDSIKDSVLVYINKVSRFGETTQFQYIFYK